MWLVFFAVECSSKKFGVLVTEPLTKFKKATETLSSHNGSHYHIEPLKKMSEFVQIQRDPAKGIDAVLNRRRREQIEQNRRLLEPVIKTVLFSGKNMLPFRGDKDDGSINLTVAQPGEGLFRNLLRFRVDARDRDLEVLLTSSAANARMTSKTIQNELIEIAGRLIIQKIVSTVDGVFSVLMDETSDASRKEQATIIIRHVHKENVREDFVGFIHAEDLTGAGLARLYSLGLDIRQCRGLGFDGASSMIGQIQRMCCNRARIVSSYKTGALF